MGADFELVVPLVHEETVLLAVPAVETVPGGHRFPNLSGQMGFDIDHDYDNDIGKPVSLSSLSSLSNAELDGTLRSGS